MMLDSIGYHMSAPFFHGFGYGISTDENTQIWWVSNTNKQLEKVKKGALFVQGLSSKPSKSYIDTDLACGQFIFNCVQVKEFSCYSNPQDIEKGSESCLISIMKH